MDQGTRAQTDLDRQVLLEKEYGPKYPCMFVFGFFPTNPILTKSEDRFINRVYLPDIFRRIVLTMHKYCLYIGLKMRSQDITFKKV